MKLRIYVLICLLARANSFALVNVGDGSGTIGNEQPRFFIQSQEKGQCSHVELVTTWKWRAFPWFTEERLKFFEGGRCSPSDDFLFAFNSSNGQISVKKDGVPEKSCLTKDETDLYFSDCSEESDYISKWQSFAINGNNKISMKNIDEDTENGDLCINANGASESLSLKPCKNQKEKEKTIILKGPQFLFQTVTIPIKASTETVKKEVCMASTLLDNVVHAHECALMMDLNHFYFTKDDFLSNAQDECLHLNEEGRIVINESWTYSLPPRRDNCLSFDLVSNNNEELKNEKKMQVKDSLLCLTLHEGTGDDERDNYYKLIACDNANANQNFSILSPDSL